jgi:hypothetical protein
MNRIHSPFTIAKHGPIAAAMFAFVLVLAGFANADAMSSAHSHKGKKGAMTITVPTEVGGILLQPGEYEVKEANSPGGLVIEFVHLWTDYTIGDSGRTLYNQDVVGQVKVTEQALSSPPKHTQLILASETAKATSLEIRGSAISYEFDQPALSAAPNAAPSAMAGATQQATVNCTNGGQQN